MAVLTLLTTAIRFLTAALDRSRTRGHLRLRLVIFPASSNMGCLSGWRSWYWWGAEMAWRKCGRSDRAYHVGTAVSGAKPDSAWAGRRSPLRDLRHWGPFSQR